MEKYVINEKEEMEGVAEQQMRLWGRESFVIDTDKNLQSIDLQDFVIGNLSDEVVKIYQNIEKKLFVDYSYFQIEQDTPVNFKQSMKLARHRWFPYKEGFSPLFVKSFITRFTDNKNIKILDVFSGVGTTVLQAGLMGFGGVGFDVNPLSNFIAQTKSINLSELQQKEFVNLIDKFEKSDLKEIAEKPDNQTIISYFSEINMQWLLKLKHFYLQIEKPYQDLFKLVFLRSIEPLSTHRKDGNGVKRKTNINTIQNFISEKDFKDYIISFLKQLLIDIQNVFNKGNSNFYLQSSLDSKSFKNHTFNAVLTSPPYANCFDYSKVYLSELWLGDFFVDKSSQIEFRAKSVRSHVHATWEERFTDKGSKIVNELIYPHLKVQNLWSNKIPLMLSGYFKDIGQMLENIYPCLENNSPIGLVVGNSVYDGIPVATDLLICDIAEKIGYSVEKIEVYRKLSTSSQQTIKVQNKEYLRESLVVLRKIT